MNAEDHMKSKLDGFFFSIDNVRGCTVKQRVPRDYMPDHKPKWDNEDNACNGQIGGNTRGREWTDADDDELVALRTEGVRWEAIARTMRRAQRTVRERYAGICHKRGLTPVTYVYSGKQTIPTEAKSAIISLRRKGIDYAEIGAEVGLSAITVRDYYARYIRDRKLSGVAS